MEIPVDTSPSAQTEIFQRLQHVIPFGNLPAPSLAALCASSVLHLHATGERIIEDEMFHPAPPVFVILSGRVRLVELEQQMTVRHLRANEVFGHFALLRKLPPPYRAEVSSVAEILEIPHAAMLAMLDRHPFFAAWFQADLRRFEREMGAFDDTAGNRFLFGQRLGEIDIGAVPVCEPGMTIREVARCMSARGSDCVVVSDGDKPVGLVSDSDLRNQVVAAGRPAESAVATIMQPDPLTINARASVFDGMMAMEDRNWRHLVLLDDQGALKGVVSDTDLARVMLNSPTVLRRRLEQADTGPDLRKLRLAADQMIVTLYQRGVRAEDLLQINTRFNDAMTGRVLEIVSVGMGDLPNGLIWCWLSLGSEGRGEMGLRTDQDNAIIHEGGNTAEADNWLARLAAETNRMLDEAGIALCEADIMAGNAQLRNDLEGWRQLLRNWISDADEDRLSWISALSDCRPVYGTSRLCSELKTALSDILSTHHHYLSLVAREALEPPLPFRHFPSFRLKGFRVGNEDALNVKLHGTHLITNAARLFCLDSGWLDQTGTSERLAWLMDNDPPLRDTARESLVAYGVLADLRLSWHVDQALRGQHPTDIMPLVKVGDTRKRLLVGAYQTVEEVRLRIRTHFGVGV